MFAQFLVGKENYYVTKAGAGTFTPGLFTLGLFTPIFLLYGSITLWVFYSMEF